jgi:glycosyltransferase involved in cell wall biosynthesis
VRTDDLVIVGPGHPYKGGIATHTTDLARAADRRGWQVTIESWASQYPSFLYPGHQELPDGAGPSPFAPTRRALRWWDPVSWWRAGWRARAAQRVAFAVVIPQQAIPYLVIMAAMRRRRGTGPASVLLCHNVLPHEQRPGDTTLMRVLLRRADLVIVHTDAQAVLARQLGASNVRAVPLPPLPPTAVTRRTEGLPVLRRLLFFGLVRPYKGVDLLLRALTQIDDVELGIHGEIWAGRDELERMIGELGLTARVSVHDGYVAGEDLPSLFAEHDALVLPYRSGTASPNVALAHQLGLPVVASAVGSFPVQIRDGVDGLLCRAEDVDDLAATIRRLYEPGVLERLRAGLPEPPSADDAWAPYLQALGTVERRVRRRI